MDGFDLVVRGGTIVDGSGGEPFVADIGVVDGVITQVGFGLARGAEEIDAQGMIVTPGFVDIHTHYDGQVTWENRLVPSTEHGVTTVLMGNCGVGFAPCRPEDRSMLVSVMEGVEDIPEIVMATGIPWNWESYPEYLDALAERSFDADIASQIPHAAIRVFVMGERAARHEQATAAELEQMTALVAEGLRAGAFGISTSRTLYDRAADGSLVPHGGAPQEELRALARGLKEAGKGVFQLITNMQDADDIGENHGVDAEAELLRDLVDTSGGRPLSFSLFDGPFTPDAWKRMLDHLTAANRDGYPIKAQVFPRPLGVLLGLDLSLHPFVAHPSYKAIAGLPLAERVAAMRDPAMRARLMSESPETDNPTTRAIITRVDELYDLGDPPVYEPDPETRIGAEAARRGVSPYEIAYDLLLAREGSAILYLPAANFAEGNLNRVHMMLSHPSTLISLGDGGAHYSTVCDSSYTTFTLAYWVRDRQGARFTLPDMVHNLTRRNAEAIGLFDRGLIAPGLKADLNILDFDRLAVAAPHVEFDLPAGGRRLRQGAEGYVATVLSGTITYRNGEPTGALPGRLLRAA